ncbi:hypothetical protein Syn7502_01872 [Synechococcus sp. PCC 7502]|uniref:DUF58 domain-containing protein n=1 Tax=Synechococcus sp. PCC 7502 TaxID=1173263 RepID=UPI00029F89B2|nr:DUF58 domain-containing protein [Synechococcus sp. PCC 7502]AFY73906.1 hypothetical protein Syn7502_01872 [Synechococcus sp. PCC 7502]
MKKLFRYLEFYFCVPEFAGGMLLMLSGFFFAAATNTLSGWLYVISGVSFALLLIGGILPRRVLRDIEVIRSPIPAVSAGDAITVELVIVNIGKDTKSLVQVYDFVPKQLIPDHNSQNLLTPLNSLPHKVIEELLPQQKLRWTYTLDTQKRGIFWFDRVDLITASPFGLFRSRRSLTNTEISSKLSQKLIVYPHVLNLSQCPLIDQIGTEETPKTYSQRYINANANEGLTKALRTYRWGDPTRLIHWRSSAKFGELKIRELEITLGGQDLVIALDTSSGWQDYQFEEAVVAAASLYFYAQGININVRLWTYESGIIQGQQQVLETLASVNPSPSNPSSLPLDLPSVWLTHRQDSLGKLNSQSRWLLWAESEVNSQNLTNSSGLVIQGNPDETYSKNQFKSLQVQLQKQIGSQAYF